MNWESVIGLEVHLQLRTGQKLFCRDAVVFGATPNSHVCPVCLGLPGALPVLDERAVELAVRTSLALGCAVHGTSRWARKNYFYPDLPKGYQITQFEAPLATGGAVPFEGLAGPVAVRIRRIHMEEDAGKSLHERVEGSTAVDLNRAGTPLVEIVTEPDLRSPEDTRAFLQKLKHLLEYLNVSDCNMEEGSLRADANVSIRPMGDAELQAKTEIKNVNSFSHIEKAIKLEVQRQIEIKESGGTVRAETLLWDDHRGELRRMRSKEADQDYRYFPEPDLPPLELAPGTVEQARAEMPELPEPRRDRLVATYGLPAYDAGVLTRSRALADYFEELAALVPNAKDASNWIMGPLLALSAGRLDGGATTLVSPSSLAELIRFVTEGRVSHSSARKALGVMAAEGLSADVTIRKERLDQVSDAGQLEEWVNEVVGGNPKEVESYLEGNRRVLGFLMGRVMMRSGGRADPKEANRILRRRLDKEI